MNEEDKRSSSYVVIKLFFSVLGNAVNIDRLYNDPHTFIEKEK